MQTKQTSVLFYILAAAVAALALPTKGRADDPGPPDYSFWTKPAWLSELSFTAKESYDDNVLGVSGLGMPIQSSWVDALSAKITFDFTSALETPKEIKAFSLTYNPEHFDYSSASSEDYTAHRINGVFKAKFDNITYSLENSFLYNDGSKTAPTYALNQLAGALANQNDKYRNNYAHALARERRNQVQDRYTASVQDDIGDFFIRPISQMTYYDLNTDLFNTSNAPYKGYQDYIDRYDINGGADLGYRVTKDLAIVFGYRDGYSFQQQFALAINSDQHFSTSHYQRVLAGLEGKLAPWLTIKASAGPDFRDYNPDTPISDLKTTRLFAEGSLVAALPENQTLTLAYKQYLFVASTGLAPYVDTTATLAYHWSVSKQFGLDLSAKYLEANYTIGNDVAGSAPALRDDVDWGASAGVSYAITKQIVVAVGYNYDDGRNNLDSLAAKYFPAYRDFTHNVTTASLQYKF
jgi:hypothetical protein